MADDTWTWTRECSLKSELGSGISLIDELLSQLKVHRWSDRDCFSVRLALEEAMVNAIKHGNQLNPEKRVRVHCRVSYDRCVLEVADEGPGFCPESIPDPTSAEMLSVPGGRGLMLMKSFMTHVEYNDSGNLVRMEKARQNDHASHPNCKPPPDPRSRG